VLLAGETLHTWARGRGMVPPLPHPGGGAGWPPPVAATHGEVRPCPHGDPDRHAQALPDPRPRATNHPRRQPSSALLLDQPPEVLTAREAAAILRVGRNQLYQAVARGELRNIRIGRTIRIPRKALLDLLSLGPPGASGDE
jgi:excisionase family DNA binding protein